jgi:hypothetical protein
MNPHEHDVDLRQLWQTFETEKTPVSAEQIHRSAQRFIRKNRRDLIARFIFALLAAAFCGTIFVNARLTSVRIIAGLVTAMLLATAVRRVYRAFKSTAGSRMPWNACVEFYRSELEKQRALATVPAWQLLVAMLVIGWLGQNILTRSISDPTEMLMHIVLLAAAGLIVLMAIRKLQGRRIQADIDALNMFETETNSGGSDDIPFTESKN